MDMFESLLTSSRSPQVDPETLEMLGRKASEMFHNGTPLNDAIVKLASEHPNLGNEHIRRIAEFANNITFQAMFQKSANKNVQFPVADPGVILRDLKDGGSPAHDGKTLRDGADYATAPSKSLEGDDELAEMFGGSPGEGQEKTASEPLNRDHTSFTNPIDDVWNVHVRLQGTRSELLAAHESMDLMLKTAKEEFYQAVKTEVLNAQGAGLGGVMGALEKIADADLVAAALTPVVERMARDNIQTQEQLHQSLEKRAGVMVNPQHPLIKTWCGLIKTANDKVAAQEALKDVDLALKRTKEYVKQASSDRPVTQGLKSILKPRLVPAALRERAVRGR